MDELDPDTYNQSAVFPPTNFDIWPMTRYSAILFDVLVLIVLVLLWIIPRKVYNVEFADPPSCVCVNQYKLWGFWVSGLDSIRVVNEDVIIQKKRGFSCCSVIDIRCPASAVKAVELKRRRFLSLGLLWAFLGSCLCGVWLHFIPCIWWSCDWGYYDGQGVRGAIWFITWGIMFVVLAVLYCTIEVVITVQHDPNSEKTTSYYLSIGEGNSRSRDDETVQYDLNRIRQGINYMSQYVKKFKYYN